MFSVFINALIFVMNILPDSFVQTFISDHIVGFADFYSVLGYVNYFVPIYHLKTMCSFWLPGMVAIAIYYNVKGFFTK